MSDSNTYKWEKEVLGTHVVYPGHPIVLACMIMDRYLNLDKATEMREDEQFQAALSDSFIPGAGCAVYSALNTLDSALKDGAESAYVRANAYWDGFGKQDARNAASAKEGLAQFEQIKARFEHRVALWGTDKMPPSNYLVD